MTTSHPSTLTDQRQDLLLPVLYGLPEGDASKWILPIALDETDPDIFTWVRPCDGCTVVGAEGREQTGCSTCAGWGWFDTTTGRPVRVWALYPRVDRVNWLLEELLPTLLEMAGYDEDAARVRDLPTVSESMLSKSRLRGTGLLEEITTRVSADWWDRLEVGPDGGRFTPPPRAVRDHPLIRRASTARWDFTTSRLGWWAYRAFCVTEDLLRAKRHNAHPYAVDVDALLDDLEADYNEHHEPVLIVQAESVRG